ncbi:helix-turn-helix domain-containing protein [Nocardioides daeguensis]|nr:helix-turn-helix domain-containing protein [Nocardioides daeguensis]MCR1773069.1 helix-turn-helix domain-containing protein [Nocardioides daeguensis]
MSPSRAALLDTLRAQTEPTTLGALASSTGLHPNTLREHLDALIDHRLAARFAAEPSGRGRPAWLYEATDPEPGGSSEYAGLAAALARSIHRRSTSPVDDAVDAGRGWGRDLASRRPAARGSSATAARRSVVELLDDMGFAPQTDARATSVRLTRCPLLEAAHQYPDVVCGVHLGLAQGALEEYGADPDGADLLPFAEPGACRLHLARHAPGRPA